MNTVTSDYKFILKKMYLCECVFNDVFSRFYHQLSNQGDMVMKEFFPNSALMSASIINAVYETILQRIIMTDEEQQKFFKKIYDDFENSKSFEEIMSNVDSFNDVKTTVSLMREIVERSMDQITDDQIKKSEDVQQVVMKKSLGDFCPIFLEPETPPAFVATKIVPTI